MKEELTATRHFFLGGREYRAQIYWYPDNLLKSGVTLHRRKYGHPDGDWIAATLTDYWFAPWDLPVLINALKEVHAEWLQSVTAEEEVAQ